MKRTVKAPLFSIILPGLGQLINGNILKGFCLLMTSGLILFSVVGTLLLNFNKTLKIVSSRVDKSVELFYEIFWRENTVYLVLFLSIYLFILLFSFFDAYWVAKRREL